MVPAVRVFDRAKWPHAWTSVTATGWGANGQGRAALSYSVATLFQSSAPHQKVEKVASDSLVTFFVLRIRLNHNAPGIVEGWA